MTVSKRLTTTVTGDGQDGVLGAPSNIARSGSLLMSDLRDVRENRVQVITLSSFGGTDSFVITGRQDGAGLGDTVAFVRGTNATSAAVQAALRTLTGDAALAVSGSTDAGPFTITHTSATFSRHFPRYTITGTGCTGVVAASPTATEGAGTIKALGESNRVSESDTILAPTVGVATVTGGTNAVHTFVESNGTDGGTITFAFKGRSAGAVAWNATAAAVQAALDDACHTAGVLADSPTVAVTGVEVATLDLGDIGAADTFKVSYNAVESTALITYAATLTTEIQTAVTELLGAGEAVVAKVDSNTYTITRIRAGAFTTTFTCTTVSGFTPLGSGGYTLGGKITTAASATPGWTFTFENGSYKGCPVGLGVITVYDDELTDGGVAETGTLAVGTPGVYGSVSQAYTENGAGDSVIAAAVNDTTGKEYGLTNDAASPVVFASLPAGDYHTVLRTVEDLRVSRAATGTFTITSS